MNVHAGRQRGYIAPSCCRRCFSKPPTPGEGRQSGWSTEAADTAFHNWTQRQTSPLHDYLDSWNSEEEIQGLYHQVYKLKRLPRSLPCKPERAGKLTRDIMSSLKHCPRQEEDGLPGVAAYPTQSQTSPGEREGTLAKVQLAEVREAHWKALATSMALEEEIEQLSCSITWDCHGAHVPSKSWDQRRRRSWSRWHCRSPTESSPAHSLACSPPWWQHEEAELDLGPPPELGPNRERVFGGPVGKEDEEGHLPAEPPVEEHEEWIKWRGQVVDTTDWWWELEMVPEVDDIQKLARKIWASFKLPQRVSVRHAIKNYYLAPPAPHCIWQKDFLLPPDLRFSCQDLWEEQWEKTMAYAQALQCWAKKANLPKLGQPHLLAGSVLELQKMMEQYIPFSDEIIFDGSSPTGGVLQEPDLHFHRCSGLPPLMSNQRKWLHPSADPPKSLHCPGCHVRNEQK